MFQMTMLLSDDRTEAALTFPSMTDPLKIPASDLDDLIRHLAWMRASMLPAHEPVDLTPQTPVSSVPAIRWQASEDPNFEGQARLYLLHPGFGWLWVPLHRAAFDDMSQKIRLFLQKRSPVQ